MAELPDDPSVHAEYCSDIDGVRFVIIDERDFDITGWRIEIRDEDWDDDEWDWRVETPDEDLDEATRQFCGFTREVGWFTSGKRTWNWNCFGFGGQELRHPWSAVCDHGKRIVRWIPPKADH